MGVPKLYRFLSERYPCLSEVIKEHQIPEFDNLYLDMNGIIHTCSHPNDDDPHFRISEEQIFRDIFHYVEVLFRMIRPRKVFFMAIDGVAPRAKMNQQRSRRFRTAKDAEMSEKRARDKGEKLPEEARFDPTCITPGTVFMSRLDEQLHYFVVNKISTDPIWQGVKVILSGHLTPGEGEHKIMDFIRHQKSLPGYDPNIRHCLYGLDADLIMLGMCTHDPHFSLLREEVRFGRRKNNAAQKRAATPEETRFHLLHLSLLREYLDHEFSDLRGSLKNFEYDLEKIIDDWILMSFLIGNDFIPHLPLLHINQGALTELYSSYKKALPSMGGYMNNEGTLCLKRFETFLNLMANNELDRFDEIYSSNKWLEGKTASSKPWKGSSKQGSAAASKKRHFIRPTPGPASVQDILMGKVTSTNGTHEESQQSDLDDDLKELLKSADDFLQDPDPDETTQSSGETTQEGSSDLDDVENASRDDFYQMEFRQHKREYYISKMNYECVTPEVLRSQAEGYVRAIQWNLHYYYNGCMSWSWFYEHHYTPWISDIAGFADMDLTFEMGEPFAPFEQLLAVLPPSSKGLLPVALQGLMVDRSSAIIDFYPTDFYSDLNGKQHDWEAVVVIPFIDQKRLLDAARPLYRSLSKEEKARNSQGPMTVFGFSPEPLGRFPAPYYFPAVEINRATQSLVWRSEWDVPINRLKKGLMEGVRLDVFFPGFPTLKHIRHKAVLKAAKVKVFEEASRNPSMVLILQEQQKAAMVAKDLAAKILGQEVWVYWPHMVEALVDQVWTKDTRFRLDGGKKSEETTIISERGKDFERSEFEICAKGIADHYRERWGVEIGETPILIRASALTGRKYVFGSKGKITLEKEWSKVPQQFALQTVRRDILFHDPTFTQYRTLPEVFPKGSTCFMIGHPNYGCQGTVLQVAPEHNGRVQLKFRVPEEIDLSEVIDSTMSTTLEYLPSYKVAHRLGLSPQLVSQITGYFPVLRGAREADPGKASKIDIGLGIKFNSRNEEVCGFTKKRSQWLYSSRAVEILGQYIARFPDLFEQLGATDFHQAKFRHFHCLDLFPENDGEGKLVEVAAFLKSLPCSTAERVPCGSQRLDDLKVRAIEEAVDALKNREVKREKVLTVQVKPHLLYKPSLHHGNSLPDPTSSPIRLFDRVVNVREGYSVPLGLRGTVIGLKPGQMVDDEVVQVLFDSEFSGGLSLNGSSPNRAYKVPNSALINISHGLKGEYMAPMFKPASNVSKEQNVSLLKQRPDQPASNPWNGNGVKKILPRGAELPLALNGSMADQQRQRSEQGQQGQQGRGRGRASRMLLQAGQQRRQPHPHLAEPIFIAEPPDPKQLPIPIFGAPSPKHQDRSLEDEAADQVWSKIQQQLKPLPVPEAPNHRRQQQHHKIESEKVLVDSMSANLKTLLNLGGVDVVKDDQGPAAIKASNASSATAFVPLQVSMKSRAAVKKVPAAAPSGEQQQQSSRNGVSDADSAPRPQLPSLTDAVARRRQGFGRGKKRVEPDQQGVGRRLAANFERGPPP